MPENPNAAQRHPTASGDSAGDDAQRSTGMASIEVTKITESFLARIGEPGSPVNQSIADKLTRENVVQIFEIEKLKETHRHAEVINFHHHRPYLVFGSIVLVLLFILLFAWLALHYSKPDIIVPVVAGVAGFVAGAFGGYGFGRASHTKTEQKPHS